MALFWAVLKGVENFLVSRNDTEEDFDEELYKDSDGIVQINGKGYTYNQKIETWLFIGTDASGQEDAEGEEYRGSMADFLLLAVIDKTNKTYGFIQLNRDTITEVRLLQTDGTGFASADIQLCTAHWYGGNPQQSCENTVEAVSKLLGGVTINGYYSLGMEEIPTLNHAVGGVEVTVIGDFSKSDPTLKEGETVLLSDEQAYSYIHNRFDVADETNTQRMERQNQYMKALFDKVHETFKQDPKFLNSLYEQLEDRAVTNTKGRDVSRIISRMADSENKGIYQIEGEIGIGQRLGDGLDHVEFYADEESIEKVLMELYHLEELEDYDPDDYEDSEDYVSDDYDDSEDIDDSEE